MAISRWNGCAALALAMLALLTTNVSAQWAWREDGGRVVYSDRPPPPSVKPAQILKQPASAAQPARTPADASNPGAAPSASEGATKATETRDPGAPKTYAEREMEFRKRQQERDAAERKAAQEQQKSAAKAAECDRTRGYLRALEDGQRITRTDKSGNREFLDDAQRAAEIERARKMVQDLCS